MGYLPVIVISFTSAWLASGGVAVLLARFEAPVQAIYGLILLFWANAEYDLTLKILSWIVALVLQFMVLQAWKAVFSSPVRLIAPIIIGLAMSTASMFLSSGMAVYQLETITLETRAADTARAPVLEAAETARRDALLAVAAIETLEREAGAKANVELNAGGSCEEVRGSGPGPIRDRSVLHSEQADQLGEIVRNWAYGVEDAADALSLAEPRQVVIEERTADLRALFRDQELAEARRTLDGMAQDMDPAIGWVHTDGTRHQCTDPDYRATIMAALDAINGLLATSIQTPRLAELTPAAGFESVWEATSARLQGRETNAVGELGLILAFCVEVLQVLIISFAEGIKRRNGEHKHRLDGYANGRSPKRARGRVAREELMANTIRDRMIYLDGKKCFVSNVPPTAEENAVILDRHFPDPKEPFDAVTRATMMRVPEFSAMREYMDGAVFAIRVIPDDIVEWLRRVERDR